MGASEQLAKAPPGFLCTCCGDCCRGFADSDCILLFPSDLARLSSGLGLGEAEFIADFCAPRLEPEAVGLPALRELVAPEGVCPFLEDDLCSVQDFKPTQCARMPFSFFWPRRLGNYKCTQAVNVPEGWSSESEDRQLVKEWLDIVPGGETHGNQGSWRPGLLGHCPEVGGRSGSGGAKGRLLRQRDDESD